MPDDATPVLSKELSTFFDPLRVNVHLKNKNVDTQSSRQDVFSQSFQPRYSAHLFSVPHYCCASGYAVCVETELPAVDMAIHAPDRAPGFLNGLAVDGQPRSGCISSLWSLFGERFLLTIAIVDRELTAKFTEELGFELDPANNEQDIEYIEGFLKASPFKVPLPT